MPPFLPKRVTTVRRSLLCGLGLFAFAGAAALLTPAPGQAAVLYKLSTTCSLKGGAPVPCTVEAEDEGAATVKVRSRPGWEVQATALLAFAAPDCVRFEAA